MQLEPAALSTAYLMPGAELAAFAAVLVQKRRVDLLDVDAAVLDRRDAGRELDELASSGLGIGVGAAVGVFHHQVPVPRPIAAVLENRLSKALRETLSPRGGMREDPDSSRPNSSARGTLVGSKLFFRTRERDMSKETPKDDPRQQAEQATHKQTDKPWKGNPEKENSATKPTSISKTGRRPTHYQRTLMAVNAGRLRDEHTPIDSNSGARPFDCKRSGAVRRHARADEGRPRVTPRQARRRQVKIRAPPQVCPLVRAAGAAHPLPAGRTTTAIRAATECPTATLTVRPQNQQPERRAKAARRSRSKQESGPRLPRLSIIANSVAPNQSHCERQSSRRNVAHFLCLQSQFCVCDGRSRQRNAIESSDANKRAPSGGT